MFIHRQQGDSPLRSIRHQGQRLAVLWMLASLLLAQALIPIQSHTRWAVADDGQVVEVCTLHGTVSVDPATGEPLAEQDDDRTAAMAFSLLLAEALSGHIEIQPAWLALLSTPVPPAVIGMPTQRPLRHAHIRAPPSLV